MQKKRGLPDGISDFKTLRDMNYYYVDKTAFIEELQEEIGKTILFTRPRRFGKTLNMSMLQYFWDIQNAKENRKLFEGLGIESSSCFTEQGKYPVIYLSFKDLKSDDWESCMSDMKIIIESLYYRYADVLPQLDPFMASKFTKYLEGKIEESQLKFSLSFLIEVLSKCYKTKVVLLVDEYDTPIIAAYENMYYDKAISFFKTLYSSALKDNKNLQIGVMTGILRVAKEGIFSGLNNLRVYSVLDEKYSSYFGLIESEVEEALEYYELKNDIQEVKEWYNGYIFGNTQIYNPWSIICYINQREFDNYWINSSSNILINQLLEEGAITGSNIFEKLKLLFEKESITQRIKKESDFHDLVNPESIWQLFLHSGYLTITGKKEDGSYELIIPNKEVYNFFEESFIEKFLGDYTEFISLVKNFEKGNAEELEKIIEEILFSSTSYLDLNGEDEKVYHVFMIGLIAALRGRYYIKSNKEVHKGRYDLSLEPKNKRNNGFILEFKVASSEKQLEKKAIEALNQIEKNNYFKELKERGISKIIGLGIAFYNRNIRILKREF